MKTAPSRSGPYKIVRSLDTGGMGEIYRARDSRTSSALAAVVTLLIIGGMGNIPAQELSFQKLAEIPIGQGFSGPFMVAAGDFDGDGKPDLVVGDRSASAGGIVVMAGNGDGTFPRGARITLSAAVTQIAVADVNRDGYPDIVATCSMPNEVALLLGNGDGTFRPLARIPLASEALAVLAEDLDGDGIADLAVGQTESILLFSGRGDGSFRDPLKAPVPGEFFGSPNMIRSADVNLDGKPDLIVLHQTTSRLSLLISTAGDGYRHEIPEVPNIGWLHDAVIADFNRDGKPDLAVCGDYGYLMLAGNGDGSFQRAKQFEDQARPFTAAARDLNGDGTPDLILGHYYGGILILIGRGDGTFDEAPRYIPTKGDNFSAVVADLDGDGRPDIVTANYSSRSVTVALGQGDGSFSRPIVIGSLPKGMAAADFDKDGTPDLVVTNYLADTLDVLRGALEPNGSYLVGENPGGVYSADFNGDGIPDLLIAGDHLANDGRLLESASVLLGTDGGGFRSGAIAEGHIAATADFDRDGSSDLAVTTLTGQTASALIYNTSILGGNSDGGFERLGLIEGIANLLAVAAGDFNHDGIPDLAVVTAERGVGAVLIYLGGGDGVFQPGGRYATVQDPRSILVADFNRDGLPDLVIPGRNSASILLGASDGSFHPAPDLTIGTPPFCNCLLAAGDFDGDGNTDVAVAQSPSSAEGPAARSIIWVHPGAGDGRFKAGLRVYTGPPDSEVSSIVAADFDGDGRTDLAVMVYNFVACQGTASIFSSRTAP